MATSSLTIYSLISSLLLLLCISTNAMDHSAMMKMMEERGLSVNDACYTPKNFDEIFLRACKKVMGKSQSICPTAWKGFSEAFGYKDPKTVKADDYSDYFKAVPVVSDPNTVVFWSGTRLIIEAMAGYSKISSSANQKSSLIVNTMTTDDKVNCWCGSKKTLYDTTTPCPSETTGAFWAKFSGLLAESSRGVTFWVGDGNRPGGAYQNTSFFAQVEFPRLVYPRVDKLVAIDVHTCSPSTGEKCGQGTLATMQNEAIDKYKKDGFKCDEVCGNANDPKQVSTITASTLKFIRAQQADLMLGM